MFSSKYKFSEKVEWSNGIYKVVPIRYQDRLEILKWRNDQIFHLRQSMPLTEIDQEHYFKNVVSKLFDQEQPNQILFSYLKGDRCIGYGGLVHINWLDRNAEISFIMDTALESEFFSFHWEIYLSLLERIAFEELNLHKIYTYAFDLRPQLYPVLEKSGYVNESILKEHCIFQGDLKDVYIHSKWNTILSLKLASKEDLFVTYRWASTPEVRMYAFSTAEIQFDHHKEWFFSKIENKNCSYFILKKGSKSVGSIRFDYIEDKTEAVISYLIDPTFHGQGLGTKILQLAEELLLLTIFPKGKISIIGYVMPENTASSYIFQKLDYSETIEENGNLKYNKVIKI